MENQKIKKGLALFISLTIIITLFSSTGLAANAKKDSVKNVILLIPDGMSISATTLTRWYQNGNPLAMDEMFCGLVRTYNSNTPIADSAPAGSAFATGYKTESPYISSMPSTTGMPGIPDVAEADQKKPLATVLEAAKIKKKSTGIISTAQVQHATPAVFSAHYPNRDAYEHLAEQQVYQNMDVVLGAGSAYLVASQRADKEDLIGEIKRLGYDYVTTPEEMKNSDTSKLWGMFAPKSLAYDFDRDPSKEPSLADMTTKAIDILSENKKGFFLMVEGSKVDWAAHANDPVGVISDLLAFDAAVKVAKNFAKVDGNTVVIVVTDHGTGGISIGNLETSFKYDKVPLDSFISPLKRAKLTGEGLESKLNSDRSNIVEVMADYYGITDLSEAEIAAIKEAKVGQLNYRVGPMMSKRANIGWTTYGHTGEDVVLYVYTPNDDRPSGIIENTDIAHYIASVLELDLDDANRRLFVDAEIAFEEKGATVELNTVTPANPFIIVTKGNTELKIPVFKNIVIKNGNRISVDGITVYNGEKIYVPQEVIDLIN